MFYSSSIGISNTVARVLLGIASQKLNRLDELQYTKDISFKDIAMFYLVFSLFLYSSNRSYLMHTLITGVFFWGGGGWRGGEAGKFSTTFGGSPVSATTVSHPSSKNDTRDAQCRRSRVIHQCQQHW
jgi:hypothetical protein